jgi:hypothetical protein
MGRDKRATIRHDMAMVMLIDSPMHGRLPARSCDISMGGMQFEAEHPLGSGEAVSLVFRLGDNGPLHNWQATVVRATGRRTAVRFRAFALDDLPTLMALLKEADAAPPRAALRGPPDKPQSAEEIRHEAV